MWANMTLITQFLFSLMQHFFALYMSIGILSAVLVIWLVRRALRAFNLIK